MENNNSRLEKLMNKAKSYCRNNKYKKAIDCYNEILQIDPTHK